MFYAKFANGDSPEPFAIGAAGTGEDDPEED
jgi:hypothetical protein